ncbi:MAG: hypothetical protein ACREO9_00905, partial [Lysobacterales bacterium]
MSLRCVSCLTVNPDTNRFCGSCGASLDRSPDSPVAIAAEAAPETQWGALKHATILFADIVSST